MSASEQPWMQGFPPPADARIRFDDGSFGRWPQRRWSFKHMDELVPTRTIWRGPGRAAPLPRRPVRFDHVHISTTDDEFSFDEAFAATFTDGLLVLHEGDIVFERYDGYCGPSERHQIMSCNKSFVGTIAECLIEEGVLADDTPIVDVLPELADSAWGDATLRHVLDMRVGLAYDEDYAVADSDVWRFLQCTGMVSARPGNEGIGFADVLPTFEKRGEHGGAFSYEEPNIFVLNWLVRRATGSTLADLVSARIWQHLGAEHDAYYQLDPSGADTSSSMTLRDFARFGRLVALGGAGIISSAVLDRIGQGGDRSAFAATGYDTLPGWSYRSQWWIRHLPNRTAMVARGAYGQMLYVDRTADVVIARFGSAREAPSKAIDHIVLPTVDAIVEAVTA